MPSPILPPLRRTAADAEAFARVVHDGQVDKAGRPYVEHLKRVAGGARVHAIKSGIGIASEEADVIMQIAWLHDTIEDTAYTRLELADEGFRRDVIDGVEYLSNNAPVRHSYLRWVESLCLHAPLRALIVKLADVEDNSDPARLALLPAETRTRLERKYHPALERLRAAVARGRG